MRLAVHISQGGTALDSHGSPGRVHMDAPHSRKVDNQSIVAERSSAHVVAATSDRHEDVVIARELHRSDNICGATALQDRARMLVHESIPNMSGLLVISVARLDQAPWTSSANAVILSLGKALPARFRNEASVIVVPQRLKRGSVKPAFFDRLNQSDGASGRLTVLDFLQEVALPELCLPGPEPAAPRLERMSELWTFALADPSGHLHRHTGQVLRIMVNAQRRLAVRVPKQTSSTQWINATFSR
jgi:hypothetical protein